MRPAATAPPWYRPGNLPTDAHRDIRPSGTAGATAPNRSGDEPAPETERDGLCPIARAELAEQPTGMGLDRVLGQEELPADLPVRLTLAHPSQHLHLTFGERCLAVHGLAERGPPRGGERVGEGCDDFRLGRVPAPVSYTHLTLPTK